MECRKIRLDIPAYLKGELDEDIRYRLEEHCAECEACRTELADLKCMFVGLDAIPEEVPGVDMSARFHTMLAGYRQGLAHAAPPVPWYEKLMEGFERIWPRRPVAQLAIAGLLLVIGIYAGRHSEPRIAPVPNGSSEVAQLRDEVREMRLTMSMSLLNQSSAVDRLEGITMSRMVGEPDNNLLDRLIGTLDNDPNVNVRLAAVDALYLFSDQPQVREALVQSLSQQESPLVQVALIDLMVEMREQKALDALRGIIDRQDGNQTVKERARWGIEQII